MGILRYGTSSWSEKSWVGPFYPAGTKPGEFLAHYATQFTTVEADVTYYRVPDEGLVSGWRQRTPEGFTIAAKFPRSIVHCGKGPRPNGSKVMVPERVDKDLARFLTSMDLLGDRCGPLVLQFPYFNRSAFASQSAFLDRLAAFLELLPDSFRYAVEIRNKNWVNQALLDLLIEHRCAFVLLDLKYMPHPDQIQETMDLITTDFVYTRLIGDREAVDQKTKTFDKIVIDHGPRLDRWSTLLRQMLDRVPEVFCYANNHYAGHGPATIRDLVARMQS